MNDIEERLRAIRPAALPPDLVGRLEAADPAQLGRRPISYLSFAAPLGAIAAVLLAAALVTRFAAPTIAPTPRPVIAAIPPPQPADLGVYLPATRRSTLVRVRDGEVVDAGGNRRVRLVHATWLDDTTYIGDDRSVLHRQSSRTEIIPVALRSF